MARNRMMPVPAYPMEPMEPMKADCIPCLEDAGLWYFASKVRAGMPVYEYEVGDAIEMAEHGDPYNKYSVCNPGVIGPIRNSVGTDSVAAMVSEGCPPNTGRDYEEV